MAGYDNDLVFTVMKGLIEGFGVLGNVLVCVTIWHAKALHNVTNLFILSLAVADALVSLCSAQSLWIPVSDGGKLAHNITQCTPALISQENGRCVYFYLQRSFHAHSVLSLVLASYERFMGINRPLHYVQFFSARRLIILLLGVWIVPLLVELPSAILATVSYRQNNCITGDDVHFIVISVASLLLFVIPTGCMIGMYAKILANLQSSAWNLRRQRIRAQPLELLRAHRKVTVSLALVVTAMVLLVLPGKIWLFVRNMTDSPSTRSDLWFQFFVLLTGLNSALNPVVYGFKYKQLRTAFKIMLCKCGNRRRQNQVNLELRERM